MTERDVGPELQTELNGDIHKLVEPASDLDGTVETQYSKNESIENNPLVTQEDLDRQEAEDYLGPQTWWEKISESKAFKKGGSLAVAAATTVGVGAAAAEAVSPDDTKSKTETEIVSEFQGKIPSEAALENFGIKASAGATDVTPAPGPEPGLPTPEAYPTAHYVERQTEIDKYKSLLVEAAGENINLEACANLIYGIKKTEADVGDPTFTHPEKTIIGNYVTVDEVINFYKTGKLEKKSNLRVIYCKDEQGNLTNEVGLFSIVNPKIKTMSKDQLSEIIDEWESICPGFLKTLNENNVWILFQSQAGDSAKVQKIKYNDIMIYFNFSGNNFHDSVKNALPVEQFGVRCKALGDEFGAPMVDAWLKSKLASLCCKNLLSIVDKNQFDYINYLFGYFQGEFNHYYGSVVSSSLDKIDSLISEVKSKNLITPFGMSSW